MRSVEKEVVVSATLDEVWRVWTTTDGIREFLAPDANVRLVPGGPFELYFDRDAPAGSRGSEGCTVLSYLPKQMFSFTWNAPPSIPEIRALGPAAWVVVRFDETGDNRVRVRVTHLGFGKGEGWDKTYEYFDRAWGRVLEWLEYRFAKGPVDWSKGFPKTRQG